ncbi:MAG: site-specific DNA-methyltransferase [Ignavibacteriota bacterium]|nr:site-specific DNA-methyltransferase [Ignavibacteriota bacterium]MCO6446343.1 site-specific DNA-methyltransferase [Ignavibacterium album]MCZ2269118.1 site-specific DNA-methyltransferase [Ignavibacteriales bacterium]MEB2297847.1 site-specific DNA-methyltransferase [Ignavibacteria bacterium]HOJ08832.1 site-specific DNA-methyltransferase [Ignavibacteriaceae bacterium]
MNTKPKLELTWIGKNEQPKLEPRILIEDPEKSYGDKNTENMLIYGDNLLALKALEQDFTGKIKCIYIDPPYNTGNAFEHYDDGLEHSLWLSLMKPRLELLKNLLSEDGSIWISIDADESHYLKVLCDEIFGRINFIEEVIWQRSYAPINLKKTLSRSHDYILIYARNSVGFSLNKLPRTIAQNKDYKNPDNDPRGLWKVGNLSVGPIVESQVYEIITPSGRKVLPPKGYCWRYSKKRFDELVNDKRIWFGKDGNNVPTPKIFLSEVKQGVTPMTLWTFKEVGHTQDSKREVRVFNDDVVFDTPKPERLINRIITLASNEGDLVLDSFLGSGTTAAVAHKMNRRWIGIELGEHCHTHCIPRLQKVCDGTDQGGISEAVNWKGGGGFKYYYLAPSLLKQDKHGNWIIEEKYNADMLAAAMAKHNNFKYQPSEEVYWKQGQSSEKDFIYTTTQFITVEKLDQIHEEMQPDESLLICCKIFSKPCENRYSNITIKKIPQMLLGKCEFGKEDYSLNIISMPRNENEPEFVPKGPEKKAKKTEKDSSPGLFTNEDQV